MPNLVAPPHIVQSGVRGRPIDIAACSQGDPGPQGAAGPAGPPGTVSAPGTTEATAGAGAKENDGGVPTTEVRTIAKLAVKGTTSEPATEFDVTSFSFGVDATVAIPVGSGSPSGGKATLAPVELQLRAGPETTALLTALFDGTHFPSATLSLVPSGGGVPVPFVPSGTGPSARTRAPRSPRTTVLTSRRSRSRRAPCAWRARRLRLATTRRPVLANA